jgi:hypothetical protein
MKAGVNRVNYTEFISYLELKEGDVDVVLTKWRFMQ